MGWKIFGGFLFFSGICMIPIGIAANELGAGFLGGIFYGVIGALLFYKGTQKGKAARIAKAEEREKAAEQKQARKDLDARSVNGTHMAGLPLSEGTACAVIYDSNKLSISGGGNTFNLDLQKITDITTKSEVEIQRAYTSSAGGAVGGAMLFGPLGAMVGGRVKEKTTRTFEYFLIITYTTDGKVSYLSFKVFDSRKADKFVQLVEGRIGRRRATVDL